MANNKTYFFQDKPIFGIDIGFSSIKVMQIDRSTKKQTITGYGVTGFDATAIENGVIVKPEVLAKATHGLFTKNLVGDITTHRAAFALPASRAFARTMLLPKLSGKDLTDAVKLEAEQYIPIPIDDLYIDYSISRSTDKETELLAIAVPKKIVDSYMTFAQIIGVEPVAIETTITAASRLFVQAEQNDIPTMLIDFGSLSTDITIYDGAIIVTGTVPGGGDSFTANIATALSVSKQEAHIVKTKYGLSVSKKQKEITEGVKPILDQMGREIRRMIRYYEERSGTERKIGQIITMGGGANMPGLSEYLINQLRLPVRMCDPWHNLNFGGLQPPNTVEKSVYITVAGLALINPRELFT